MKEIPLTQGKFAWVDDVDFERVNAHKWCACKRKRRFYAMRRIRKSEGGWTTQSLHQFLIPDVKSIDHRDGDGLNNRKANLRVATDRQNSQAYRRKAKGKTSQYRGVCWREDHQKWRVQISLNGNQLSIGCYDSEREAALAYDRAAQKLFGEFASLNFPLQAVA